MYTKSINMKELGIAITLVSFILLSGCKDKTEPERQVVAVEKVGVDNVEIYGEYVGQIRAKGFVEVRARVEGYLEQMLFEEGKRVKRNQPLFKINSDLYQARVDKAKAQLAKDQAQEAKAERDVERLRPLYEQKAASQLDLDNAVAAYESAKANVAMSKAESGYSRRIFLPASVRLLGDGITSDPHVFIINLR